MYQQNSYMTLIGVHSTMHLVHAKLMSCNYYMQDLYPSGNFCLDLYILSTTCQLLCHWFYETCSPYSGRALQDSREANVFLQAEVGSLNACKMPISSLDNHGLMNTLMQWRGALVAYPGVIQVLEHPLTPSSVITHLMYLRWSHVCQLASPKIYTRYQTNELFYRTIVSTGATEKSLL